MYMNRFSGIFLFVLVNSILYHGIYNLTIALQIVRNFIIRPILFVKNNKR